MSSKTRFNSKQKNKKSKKVLTGPKIKSFSCPVGCIPKRKVRIRLVWVSKNSFCLGDCMSGVLALGSRIFFKNLERRQTPLKYVKRGRKQRCIVKIHLLPFRRK